MTVVVPVSVPRLEGPRVLLRATEERDVDDLFEVFSSREVMRYWSRGPFTGRDEAVALVEGDRRAVAAGEALRFGVIDRATDRLIGTVSLHQLHVPNRRAELGYLLGRASWGRGLASEAVGLVVAYAFDELGLHRLEADTDPRNHRSCRLLERIGFRLEGVLRERWIVDGEVSDSAWYGLLAHER